MFYFQNLLSKTDLFFRNNFFFLKNMALGKRCGSSLKSKRVVGGEELGLGSVRYPRAFGRKRILISNHFEGLAIDSAPKTPSKKMCGERLGLDSERSLLEALPQDILVSTKFFSKLLILFLNRIETVC